MSKTRRWLPNATSLVIGGVGSSLDTGAWERIEKALAQPLDPAHHERLAEIISDYIAARSVELAPPLAEAANGQVDDIERAAMDLRIALRTVLNGDDVSDRVSRLFGYALREVEIAHLAHGKLSPLDQMLQKADGLVLAAARVREKLAMPGETESKAPDFAWNDLVSKLKAFATERGVKISARKDYSVNTGPFVKFVKAVQAAVPQEYRRHTQSDGALSKAISAALSTSSGGTNKWG